MKNVLKFAVFLISLSLTAQSRNPGTVSGKVIDGQFEEPVPYASVVARSGKDGKIITGGTTSEDGSFEIKGLPEGEIDIEIQYIGYKTHRQAITISPAAPGHRMDTVVLEENIAELEGVDVVAERSTIEQKTDRKIINVGKDLTTTGATASEIMNNIPSVNVDQDGNLALRGNQNVRVMVDGKLSNVPVAQLLKQIPSTSIKKIELITNPSAKYNPEGMSGIINIVLHKNANIGLNGNINLGLTKAENAKFNSSVDLNYRHGKINVYGSYGNNIGKYSNNGRLSRSGENMEQQLSFDSNHKSHLYKAGLDFYLNDRNTISVFTNQNTFDGKEDGASNIIYFDDEGRNFRQSIFSDDSNHSQQYNFDYKLDFAREGHNIELEVDHNRFSADGMMDNTFSGPSDVPDYIDNTETKRQQTTANLDYVNPLSEKSNLELGAEARLFETNLDFNSTGMSFSPDGDLVPTPSTKFDYNMDIYSAYATFGQNFGKWSYQVGARIENVEVRADTNTVRAFTDRYTQVYPSAFVTYSPSEKNQYQVSFSRRVDRPGIGQVNPIRKWSTPLISQFGNESLSPQFTNSIEANYTRRIKEGSITAGVFYRRIEDEINQTIYADPLDRNRLILTYDNFENNASYGVELSGNYKPLKWWNFNTSFDLFTQTQKGYLDMEYAEIENTSYNFRLNNNFTVTKALTLSLFGFYRGRNKSLQFDAKPMYFVNTGARYAFADGKGSISLNINDIFNTMRFGFDSDRPIRQSGRFTWESNSVYLGLSYRFGSGKNRQVQRKNRDDNTKEGGGIM
ncbi:TonB-dependent receptor domain-containing protein [Sinomicrobium soli]|uniref:TonB-dependent receptor domain-containing protein n=1 Tax=Sinomicrobium sp. N-1-3-6 TaxID=2219864 RepID=UPI000DCC365C|nr:outer membrane beta-barrel family protein [Sinomicrobium sp. N-1-3-6]RAV30588.1 TonB-dependent receptor [Sinomicrobium sp. N-1-3-6]